MTDLLEWLDAHTGTSLHELSQWLGGSSRTLANGWWHAGDVEQAYEQLTERLKELGIEPFSMEAFEAWQKAIEDAVDDEEELRRHQLGFAAVHANARSSNGRRFHCMSAKLCWETEEPAWLLLDDREHEALVALGGPPPLLEAAYSGKSRAPTRIDAAVDLSMLAPNTAERKADAEIRAGRFEEALLYLSRVSEEGDFGLLVRLKRIDVLRKAGRTDEARVLWAETANAWLEGKRRVWDTQWKRLLALHADLDLPNDDPRLNRIRALAVLE